MRKIYITLFILASLSFLGAILSVGRDPATAGGRLFGAILFGGVGLFLLWLNDKMKEHNKPNKIQQNIWKCFANNKESYWQWYRNTNPEKAESIEMITGKDMSLLGDKDAYELVSSMERWANNIGCNIKDLKVEFLKNYFVVFDNDETEEIIKHLKSNKLTEEANHFQISTQNTCAYYMIKWLQEEIETIDSQKMKSRNRMSARELVVSENATLQFIENPETGNVFFVCGSKKGYISPAAKEHIQSGELDDFVYAEVSLNGKPYIPCLMLKKQTKVIRTISVNFENS